MTYTKEVLEALQGHLHFRNNPSDRSINAHNPDMIVLHCNDAGVDSAIITRKGELGKQFTLRNISGAVPPRGNLELQASLNYPLFNKPSIKAIMIMGHTNCGGIAGLVDAVIDKIPPGQSDTIKWMSELVTPELKQAIEYAWNGGATRKEIAAEVEKIMPIMSCLRLLNYTSVHEGKAYKVGDVIREKGIKLIPALYHVERDTSDPDAGKLYLFEHDSCGYKPLEEILRQQGSPLAHVSAASCSANTVYAPHVQQVA